MMLHCSKKGTGNPVYDIQYACNLVTWIGLSRFALREMVAACTQPQDEIKKERVRGW